MDEKVNINLVIKSKFGINNLKLSYKGIDLNNFHTYESTLSTNDLYGSLFYFFEINDLNNNTICYYSNNEDLLGGEGSIYYSKPNNFYQITVFDIDYEIPSWYTEGIMYHILIDRFNDEDNNKKEINEDLTRHYGGTLRGIINKLDYLESLNINILCLTPVLEASSYHKYNVGDYEIIDSALGTLDDFKELINELKKRNMHLIFDLVYNHCGDDSKYFNKYNKYSTVGAYNSKESDYYNWFIFDQYPDEYESYFGFKGLPSFNTENKEFLNYVLFNENSILNYWSSFGIDGVRLDAANLLNDKFIKKIFNSFKKINPNSVILGEYWDDATNHQFYKENIFREYMMGEELESVTNYPLHGFIINYCLGQISAKDFKQKYYAKIENFPLDYFKSTQNFLSNHDIPRVYTLLNEDYKLLKIAVSILFTLPGVPTIYYGDEAGLIGADDPENRLPFPWNNINKEVFNIYKKFASIRFNEKAIKKGKILFYDVENPNILLYKRFDETDEIYILINKNNYKTTVKLDEFNNNQYINLLTNKLIYDVINLEEYEIKILKKK